VIKWGWNGSGATSPPTASILFANLRRRAQKLAENTRRAPVCRVVEQMGYVHVLMPHPGGLIAKEFAFDVAEPAWTGEEEAKTSPGTLYGEPRPGAWCAVEVQGRIHVPVGPVGEVIEVAYDVVQGLPRLVVAGRVPKLKAATATRTAVCADGARITLVATTSRVEIAAFARFLALPRARGGVGCKDALNLDGGHSTQLHARLPKLELDVKGGWGVPNALVVLPRHS